MAYGDRKSPRVAFESGIKAYVVGIDGSWRRECKVQDISQTGALITIAEPVEGLHTKEFFLALSTTGSVHRRCEFVRQSGEQIGVRFLKGHDGRK